MARKLEYNEEVQKKADEYADGGYEEAGDIVPSVSGLACELGRRRGLIYEWADRFEEFQDTLDRIKETQERKLLSGGLSGQHNATIVKLMLANHGYSDKQSQEISGPEGGPVQSEQKVKWEIQPVKPIDADKDASD